MNYPKTAKIRCSHCNGKGFIRAGLEQSQYVTSRKIRNSLRHLKKQGKLKGLSLRKICELLGVKAPNQIKWHLGQIDKLGWSKFE